MSLLTKEYSTKTSKEQGKEVMTTPSVSAMPAKTISLTYIPPLSSHTQGVKSINAHIAYLEQTPQPLPQILSTVRGPTTPANKNQYWAPHKQPQGRGPTKRILQFSSTDPKHKKMQKQKSTFKKGIKGQIPVQYQQDHQGRFPLGGAIDTQPQGWERSYSKPHKGETPKQSRKWGIHR